MYWDLPSIPCNHLMGVCPVTPPPCWSLVLESCAAVLLVASLSCGVLEK